MSQPLRKAFPISWVTTDRRVMLIGGCDGDLCRLKTALEFDWAHIDVFVRECCETLCDTCPGRERVEVHTRLPKEADVEASDLILESTMCRALAETIHPWAKKHGVPICTMDKLDLCDFHYPALVLRGPMVISILTGGAAPAVSSRLRKELTAFVGPGWETATRLFAEKRMSLPAGQERSDLLKRLANDPELLQLIREDDEQRMRNWLENAH
jgi:siroheme synthase-like protein